MIVQYLFSFAIKGSSKETISVCWLFTHHCTTSSRNRDKMSGSDEYHDIDFTILAMDEYDFDINTIGAATSVITNASAAASVAAMTTGNAVLTPTASAAASVGPVPSMNTWNAASTLTSSTAVAATSVVEPVRRRLMKTTSRPRSAAMSSSSSETSQEVAGPSVASTNGDLSTVTVIPAAKPKQPRKRRLPVSTPRSNSGDGRRFTGETITTSQNYVLSEGDRMLDLLSMQRAPISTTRPIRAIHGLPSMVPPANPDPLLWRIFQEVQSLRQSNDQQATTIRLLHQEIQAISSVTSRLARGWHSSHSLN